MNDDTHTGFHFNADEPSPADFEAAEEERAAIGAKAVLGRVVKVVVGLLLVVALLAYFIEPFNTIFGNAYRWWRPSVRLHAIPLAPERRGAPKQLG